MIYESVVAVVAACAMSFAAYRYRFLTVSGSVAALFVAVFVGVLGGLDWLLLIIVFVLAAFITTRFRIVDKLKKGVQEGRHGERGAINVVANSLVAVIIAILNFSFGSEYFSILFLVAIASATSDTVASEVGVIDERTRLITNLRPVPPSTNGGVSPTGTIAALLSSLFICFVGLGLMIAFGRHLDVVEVLIASLFGFAGSIIDSVLGATLERRGIIGKQTNNFTSIALACLFAFVLFH
ncbi:MAG: DUF92 domain-containing protein [Methanomassiliicoccales archaeon]